MRRSRTLLLAVSLSPIMTQQIMAQQNAQTPAAGERPRAAGQSFRSMGVAGTVTSIQGKTLKIKTMGGDDATVKVGEQTRFFKDQKEASLGDFKAGDSVYVGGEQAPDGVWSARVVGSGAMRLGGGGSLMMSGPGGMTAEDLGKKFIVGKVKAINGVTLTIERVDNQTQVIAVDENTSFRRQQESITLADIKPGDQVIGRGQLKDGTFVASTLNVGDFAQQMRMFTQGASRQ